MQKKDAAVVRAAVQAFRDVLWAPRVAGGLWDHPALSLHEESIFIFHPGSGGTKYLEMLCSHPEGCAETELPACDRDSLETSQFLAGFI